MKDNREEPEITEQEILELADWLESLKFHEVRALKEYYESLPAFETQRNEEANVLH